MVEIPAQHQTDPKKKPGQIVNPIPGDKTLEDYYKRKGYIEKKECCGNPFRNGGCKDMGPWCSKP